MYSSFVCITDFVLINWFKNGTPGVLPLLFFKPDLCLVNAAEINMLFIPFFHLIVECIFIIIYF